MKTKKNNLFITFAVVALVVGALGGIIATIITENYLDRYKSQLESDTTPPRLSEERARAFPGTYSDAIVSVREKAVDSAVEWHHRRASSTNIARASYQDSEPMGTAVVLSSDGWVVTQGGLFTNAQAPQTVAIVNGQVYDVIEVISDSETNMMFVKLDANNLPVARFGTSEDVLHGDRLFVIGEGDSVLATSVVQTEDVNPLVVSSESLGEFFVLRDAIDGSRFGAGVFNSAGDLVGVVSRDPSGSASLTYSVRPLHALLPAVQSVLRDNAVSRPRLGVTIVSLPRAIGYSGAADAGALVVSSPLRNTPAADAGIKLNDVLLRVNGEGIGLTKELSEILLDYRPGDTVTISIRRDDEEMDVEVVLDELP